MATDEFENRRAAELKSVGNKDWPVNLCGWRATVRNMKMGRFGLQRRGERADVEVEEPLEGGEGWNGGKAWKGRSGGEG